MFEHGEKYWREHFAELPTDTLLDVLEDRRDALADESTTHVNLLADILATRDLSPEIIETDIADFQNQMAGLEQ